MRMSTKRNLAVCLVLVAACGDSTSPPPPDLVLAPLAKVLDASNASDLDAVSADQSTISFFEGGAFDDLSTGSILVAGVTPATPNGLLRRVVSVSQVGGRIVAFTEPATLTQAVESGTFGYHGPAVTGAASEEAFQASVVGVRGGASAAAGELFVEISDLVLHDADGQPGTNDEITVSGQLTFRPDLDVDIDIGLFSVEHLLLSYEDHPTVTLDATSGVGLTAPSLDLAKEVGRWPLPAIPIPSTPFVLTPVAIVRVGLTGSVETGLSIGATLTADVIAGIECRDGSCRNIGSVVPRGDLRSVEFTAAATLEAFAKAALDVCLNALFGGNVAGTAYLNASVDLFDTPWWRVDAGIKGGAGVSAVWGLVEIGYRDFFDVSVPIAAATPRAPAVRGIDPTSGPTSGGTTVSITGADFVDVTGITIGGTALANPLVVNRATIIGTTPAGAAGGKDVVVTTVLGSGTCAGCFTYTGEGTPVSPSNLVAIGVSASRIDLTWLDNSTNEDGFRIERCAGVGCSGFTELTTVGASGTAHQNAGLTAGTSYSYRVSAYNVSGVSEPSNTATGTTQGAPTAPSNLVSTVVSASQINLAWQDNSSNEDGFRIERCTGVGCTDFNEIAIVGASATTYQSAGLAAQTRYMYRVRSYNAGGSSGYSNTVDARTRVAITGRIAFLWGGVGLSVLNPDGSTRQLTTQGGGMDWSPDGTKIVFQSNRDGNWEVYVMNADGSGVPSRLTNDPSEDATPAWSPDGTKIAFVSFRFGANSEIHVMNADGSGVTRVTDHPASDRGPAWSPDGTKIAFASLRFGTNSEIHVMNADGSGLTRVTNHPALDGEPAWSPDGAKIVFMSNRDGNHEIYVMNADGSGVPTRLTSHPQSDSWPSWSPDGTKIVFMSTRTGLGDYELHLMNADGSAVTPAGVLGLFRVGDPEDSCGCGTDCTALVWVIDPERRLVSIGSTAARRTCPRPRRSMAKTS